MANQWRQWVGARHRATSGQRSVTSVQRPSTSRFIIAAICGWLLWQPLSGRSEIAPESRAEASVAVVCLVTSH